jgi:hypothetical protein
VRCSPPPPSVTVESRSATPLRVSDLVRPGILFEDLANLAVRPMTRLPRFRYNLRATAIAPRDVFKRPALPFALDLCDHASL